MGVAEGGLGDGERGLRAQRGGEAVRAELEQPLAGSGGRGRRQVDVPAACSAGLTRRRRRSVRLVDRDIGEPVEDLGAAVLRDAPAQQLGALVDERGAEVAGDERRVVEHRLQEGDVRGDAADAELGEGALRAGDRGGVVAAAAGELREHRVEVRADLRAGVDGAAVEADAGAAGRAVRRDLAGVGAEAGGRVLGRDAALQGGPAEPDGVLREAELGEGLPRGDAHLRQHEVDVGDLLGDGVLDLDARVHLDEHVLAGALAHRVEQELDGAGVHVADRLRERDGVAVQRPCARRRRGSAPARSR